MGPSTSNESKKQENWIQIGKTRHRIANNHHVLLEKLHAELPYVGMADLLFLTSMFGASVLLVCNPIALLNVRKSGQG